MPVQKKSGNLLKSPCITCFSKLQMHVLSSGLESTEEDQFFFLALTAKLLAAVELWDILFSYFIICFIFHFKLYLILIFCIANHNLFLKK